MRGRKDSLRGKALADLELFLLNRHRDDLNTISLSSGFIIPVISTFWPSRYIVIPNMSSARRLPS
jgi:hypothetical protein